MFSYGTVVAPRDRHVIPLNVAQTLFSLCNVNCNASFYAESWHYVIIYGIMALLWHYLPKRLIQCLV